MSDHRARKGQCTLKEIYFERVFVVVGFFFIILTSHFLSAGSTSFGLHCHLLLFVLWYCHWFVARMCTPVLCFILISFFNYVYSLVNSSAYCQVLLVAIGPNICFLSPFVFSFIDFDPSFPTILFIRVPCTKPPACVLTFSKDTGYDSCFC